MKLRTYIRFSEVVIALLVLTIGGSWHIHSCPELSGYILHLLIKLWPKLFSHIIIHVFILIYFIFLFFKKEQNGDSVCLCVSLCFLVGGIIFFSCYIKGQSGGSFCTRDHKAPKLQLFENVAPIIAAKRWIPES